MITGNIYRFKVSAFNYNGEGALSTELSTFACISPSNMAAPTRISSTLTSLMLNWSSPTDDGGCPITGFAVFRDDGAGSDINVEVNSALDTNIRDKPTLF